VSGRHTACHFPRAVGQGGYDADGLLPACGHLHDIIDGRTPFWSLGRWLDEVGREVWELEFLAVSYVLRAKANYRFEAMDF
jgi:hypothetical protein